MPGLAAKPIIDILLLVPDSRDEPAYVPALEAAGYVFSFREPDWFEHRMFKGPDTRIHLHVFSSGEPEAARMLRFRDHLRVHDADRELYERTKRELAQRDWTVGQDYADAKTQVVQEILGHSDIEMTGMPGVDGKGMTLTWWKQVKNKAGKMGWTTSVKFQNADACG